MLISGANGPNAQKIQINSIVDTIPADSKSVLDITFSQVGTIPVTCWLEFISIAWGQSFDPKGGQTYFFNTYSGSESWK